MKIRELTDFLEQLAPPVYQEGYDNAGLLVGNAESEIRGVLVCLDSTEAVIQEAVERGCNLVVAHHPIIFKGLKQLTGRTYVERVVMQAIRHDIAVYAIHTNLDNVYHQGVNSRIAERLGLQHTRLLAPRREFKKLSSLVPAIHRHPLEAALIQAGAHQVVFTSQATYSSFAVEEVDSFDAEYLRLEVLFPSGNYRSIVDALQNNQPDEQVHFDVVALENPTDTVGAGLIGELAEPEEETAFLQRVKDRLPTACIRHTRLLNRPVSRVAVCGGAGSFLLPLAMARKADVFITADFKYHEFFDADDRIVIADIGHYESEQFTIQLLQEIISKKFTNFAAYCTRVVTNPVQYLI